MNSVNDNPYAASSELEEGKPAANGAMRIDNWWFAVATLMFGRIVPAIIATGAIWNAFASLLSIFDALHGGGPPTRIDCLRLMISTLWVVMMAILYSLRGRNPIVFWAELGDRIVLSRLGGIVEYDWSQVARFDYEGVGNRTRIAVARAPGPSDGRRILVISLSPGAEFRFRVNNELDARLKQLATRLESHA